MDATGRYKSRLLSYVVERSQSLRDQAARSLRYARTGVVWGAQMLLYPLYAAFQASRVVGRRFRAADTPQQVIQLPESPEASEPVEKVLELAQAIADQSAISLSPWLEANPPESLNLLHKASPLEAGPLEANPLEAGQPALCDPRFFGLPPSKTAPARSSLSGSSLSLSSGDPPSLPAETTVFSPTQAICFSPSPAAQQAALWEMTANERSSSIHERPSSASVAPLTAAPSTAVPLLTIPLATILTRPLLTEPAALMPASHSSTKPIQAIQARPDQQPVASHTYIRGIASQTLNRALVLVDNQNRLVTLSSEQQWELQQQIVQEIAGFAYRQRQYCLLVQQRQRPLPPPESNRPTLFPAVRWGHQLMGWMQRSPIARGLNLFHEARLHGAYLNGARQSLLSTPLPTPLPDSGAAPAPVTIPQVTLLPPGTAQPSREPSLKQSVALQLRQGWITDSSLAKGPAASAPLASSPRESALARGHDAVEALKQEASKQEASKQGQQPSRPPLSLTSLASAASLRLTNRLTSRLTNRPTRPSTDLSARASAELSAGSSATASAQASTSASLSTQAETSHETTWQASYIETTAIVTGYIKHPLEWVLEKLDRLLVWIEEAIALLWQWIQLQFS